MKSLLRRIYLFTRNLSVFLIGFDFYAFKVNQAQRIFAKRAILKRNTSFQELFKRARIDQRNDHRVALSLALEQYYDGRVECFSSFNLYHDLREKWLSDTGLEKLGIDFIDVGVVAGSFGNLYSLETLIQAKKIGLSKSVNDIVLIKGENFKPRNGTLFSYFEEFGVRSRFDDAETIYVKRMLQHVLPEKIRHKITSQLFELYVGVSQADFSENLYMNVDEVSQLVKSGMYVGSHGSKHYWLNRISPEQQTKDIHDSLTFLESVGAPTSNWVMCYPFGAFNNDTLAILRKFGAAIGVTTEARKVDLTRDDCYQLPRLDTNDYPQ